MNGEERLRRRFIAHIPCVMNDSQPLGTEWSTQDKSSFIHVLLMLLDLMRDMMSPPCTTGTKINTLTTHLHITTMLFVFQAEDNLVNIDFEDQNKEIQIDESHSSPWMSVFGEKPQTEDG